MNMPEPRASVRTLPFTLVKSTYRVLSLPEPVDGVDFLTVNGIRFIKADGDTAVIGPVFANAMAAIVVIVWVIGVMFGAWLFGTWGPT